MDKWNKMRWVLALLFAGLPTQAALVYAVLFLRQAAHGAPAFWNGGYAVLWSMWATLFWITARDIRRQESTYVPISPFRGYAFFTAMAGNWTTLSYIMPRRLPSGKPGAAFAFLILACVTMTVALAFAWYEKRRLLRAAGPRRDAS